MTARPPLAQEKLEMLIGGRWTAAASGDYFESFDPFTGKAWALLPRASVADADQAIEAAAEAFRGGCGAPSRGASSVRSAHGTRAASVPFRRSRGRGGGEPRPSRNAG